MPESSPELVTTVCCIIFTLAGAIPVAMLVWSIFFYHNPKKKIPDILCRECAEPGDEVKCNCGDSFCSLSCWEEHYIKYHSHDHSAWLKTSDTEK